MHQRYNRVSPLLETWPGYRGYLGHHARKLDEDSEHLTQIQKRRCLAKVDDGAGCVRGNSFGQAPAQSTERAAKILKHLDTLAPSQNEGTTEIKQGHRNAVDAEDSSSRRKEMSSQGSLLEPTLSLIQDCSLSVAAKFTPAAIDGKTVVAILENKLSSELASPKYSLKVDNRNRSTVSLRQSIDRIEKSEPAIEEHTAKNSGTTNKENPPTFSLQSYSPNLVLSREIDKSKMPASSNGFSFPIIAALDAHSQAPRTPTMASPSALLVGRISKGVSEEGSTSNKHDKKLNGEIPTISSKTAGHVPSFTSNPVFSVLNSKPTTLSNGLAHTASAVLPSNGLNNPFFSTNAGSSTSSLLQFSFQPGFQTSSTSAQQSGGIQSKEEPVTTLPFSMHTNSTGGSFTFSNTGPSSSSTSSKIFAGTTSQSAGAPPSGISSAPFSFSLKFGAASFLAVQDKSKTESSSTPLNFSPQSGSGSSAASLEKSKVTSSESAMLSGNMCTQAGSSNSLSTQSSASKSNSISPEKSNMASLPSFANSQFSSAPSSSSPFCSSSVVPFAATSGTTSVNTPLSLPATSSALGPSKAFSASPFSIPNAGSAISPFSSTSSTVSSFTSATPAVPNPSPSTPLFGSTSPSDQMNGGHMAGEGNQSPFSTTPPYGFQSNSPLTPVFSMPATQFASTTSTTSPGIFQFGQQSQASPGVFSMGSVRDNDKSGRRIIKVKRKK
uniref:Uncharacterized protein n=1 Tax=Avena sativa TaxID=4498 RepID=A0ACD5Y8F4_AVESA